MNYLVYGKKEGQKRFSPLNVNADQVVNLLHAIVFWGKESISDAEKFVEIVQRIFPTMKLEIRSQKD